MPVLELEPAVFPDAMFGDEVSKVMPQGAWWVLRTRPRAEKALARRLWRRKVSYFLPQSTRCRRGTGGSRFVRVPMFPGYLFLHGDDGDRVTALETNLVAQCLRVVNESELHAELAGIHRLMNAGLPLHPENRLQPGSRVEIVDGPLTGLTGKVVRKGRQLRFIVEVEMLQRGVSIELEGWMIRPA